jgi:hypothetical protein
MMSHGFSRFTSCYHPDQCAKRPASEWSEGEFQRRTGQSIPEYTQFLREVAHSSYEGGLIRFFLPEQHGRLSLFTWNGPNGWPCGWRMHSSRLFVFACDWLGRQIAFDRERTVSGEPAVTILEPGTGELLEVPRGFRGFLEEELTQYAEAALAVEFYQEWRLSGGAIPDPTQCVGYIRPLFLGGRDVVENLETIDMEVYVQICGALFAGAATLKEGESISSISID